MITTKQMEIEKFNPCREALVFRSQYSSFKEAWEACPRGDWMLWIAQKLDVDLMPMTAYIAASASANAAYIDADAADADITKSRKETADICREVLTKYVMGKL